ncbi:lipopolysaccharide biosynthesis protein [Aureicoccus marinus]|uniref:lipopolysaccharide biosynthesis protein n=1 Tax=Aureicoccus marinus TaxID=754435 RepID=UPI0026B954B6|nr:oligosaccharide flippase family protein [Aureicoccus marinus]
MNPLKKLFQQTFVYGIATVLPRVLSFLLLPLYTGILEKASGYGEYINIYAWIAFFNVLLAYGMETAFFRFYHKEKRPEEVVSTSLVSLIGSTLIFGILGFLFIDLIAEVTGIRASFLKFTLVILLLDALVIIPFALIRAKEKPLRYAFLKTLNVALNFVESLLFGRLASMGRKQSRSFLGEFVPRGFPDSIHSDFECSGQRFHLGFALTDLL